MFQWLKNTFGSGVEPVDGLLRKAEALRAEGKTRDAEACCEEVLRRRPDDARALCLMAKIAADTRNTARGLEWARRAAASSLPFSSSRPSTTICGV